ncbi:SufD family Fe-S cluster assembly protein [Candidatus Woesearchaeota archaeon]|nr:SufD family Fe-S cluster assembly protein [Candidatus Woesearchaeota archaeon]
MSSQELAKKKAVEDSKVLPMPEFKYGITVRLNADEKAFCVPSHEEVDTIPFGINMALSKESSFILEYDDKLSALHAGLLGKSIFIHIPEGFVSKTPVIISNNITKNACIDAIRVVVEPNADVILIEKNDFCNVRFSRVNIEVKHNSKLTYASSYSNKVLWVRKNAVVGDNASLQWCECVKSTHLAYSRTFSKLDGRNSSVDNTSVFSGCSGQFDIGVTNEHVGSFSKSNLLSKGVLDGTAKGIAQGTIIVGEHAFKSDSYQKEDLLLLGDNSEGDSIPQLFIHNHDVRCTHGASVSSIDENQLFYLSSRGISFEDAKNLLVDGFLAHAVKKMPKEAL